MAKTVVFILALILYYCHCNAQKENDTILLYERTTAMIKDVYAYSDNFSKKIFVPYKFNFSVWIKDNKRVTARMSKRSETNPDKYIILLERNIGYDQNPDIVNQEIPIPTPYFLDFKLREKDLDSLKVGVLLENTRFY